MRFKFGATKRFPRGHLNAHDEGEIIMGVAADKSKGVVMIEFGSPVAWLGLPLANARALAASINSKADEIEGIKPELPS